MSRDQPKNEQNYPSYPMYPYPVYPYPVISSPHINPQASKNLLTESFAQTDPIKKNKKPENQYEFNQMYRKPLESYDFREFREKTLPMIRINKLKKIQALVRGWYTRKFILPFKRRIRRVALHLTEDFIEEFIEDRLLPDIILEIINTNFAYKDYSLYAPEYRLLLQIADNLENQLIHGLCEEVVKDITRFIVNDYLRKRNEELIVNKKFDALSITIDELIDIIIDKELPILTKETIRDEANDYLLEANIVNFIRNEFVPIYCREVINEASWEIAQEDFLNECLEFIIYQYINDVIIDSAEGEKDRIDLETLENAFNAFIERSILKEAINELMFLNKEYHDEEYLRNNAEEISQHDLDEFILDQKDKDFGDDDFFDEKSPRLRDSSREGIEEKKINKNRRENEERKGSFGLGLPSNESGNSLFGIPGKEKPAGKGFDYQFGSSPGLRDPKSPRNKKRPIIPEESSSISHGRRGTKTFYQEN